MFKGLILACLAVSIVALGQETSQETWTLAFEDADMRVFIDEVSRITGKAIVSDPRLEDRKITVASQIPFTEEQVWQLFLRVAEANDFAIAENDGIYSIVSANVARTIASVPSNDATASVLASRVFVLSHIDSAEALKALRTLVAPGGQLSDIDEPNALLITDRLSNIERFEELLTQLDKPPSQELKMVQLTHSSIFDLLALLKEIEPSLEAPTAPVRVVGNPKTNSLVLYGSVASVQKISELIEELDIEVPSNSTRLLRLNYSDPADAIETVDKLLGDEHQGDAGDQRTAHTVSPVTGLNALIARGSLAYLKDVEAIVEELNTPRDQVLIEAAIAEVTLAENGQIGIELGAADNGSSATPVATTSVSGLLAGLLTTLDGADGSELQASDALGAFANPSLALARIRPDGISFGAIVTALTKFTNAQLLSVPYSTVLDGVESHFFVGKNIPQRTGNVLFSGTEPGVGRQTTSRANVGITFDVVPFVQDDNSIRLQISSLKAGSISLSEDIGASGFADVVTNEREFSTEIVVADQQTILLGGLISNDETRVTNQIPVLGSVPILGRLFKSDTKRFAQTQVLLLIRPTILSSENRASEALESRMAGLVELTLFGEGDEAEAAPISPDDLYDGNLK